MRHIPLALAAAAAALSIPGSGAHAQADPPCSRVAFTGAEGGAGRPIPPTAPMAPARGARGEDVLTALRPDFGDEVYAFSTRTPEGAAGHFTIYYTTQGKHEVTGPGEDNAGFIPLPTGALGCDLVDGGGPSTYSTSNAPDYVETLGCYLEFALRGLANQGFGGGRVPRAIGRVFVVSYEHSGTSMPLNIPLLSGDILINHAVSWERLPTLATHELFHQFQYTDTRHLEPWWTLEGTAAWSEDLVFEDVNDYAKHIRHFMDAPDMGLMKASYDAIPFWRYVTERYGEQDPRVDLSLSWMQDLWAHLGEGLSGEEATHEALLDAGYDLSLNDVFNGPFALALALKDLPLGDPALTFDENDEVDLGQVALVDGAPQTLNLGGLFQPPTRSLPRYGLHYYHFKPGAAFASAQVVLTSPTGTPMTVQVAAVAPGGTSAWFGRGEGPVVAVSVPSFPVDRELYVVVGSGEAEGDYDLIVTGEP